MSRSRSEQNSRNSVRDRARLAVAAITRATARPPAQEGQRRQETTDATILYAYDTSTAEIASCKALFAAGML